MHASGSKLGFGGRASRVAAGHLISGRCWRSLSTSSLTASSILASGDTADALPAYAAASQFVFVA